MWKGQEGVTGESFRRAGGPKIRREARMYQQGGNSFLRGLSRAIKEDRGCRRPQKKNAYLGKATQVVGEREKWAPNFSRRERVSVTAERDSRKSARSCRKWRSEACSGKLI